MRVVGPQVGLLVFAHIFHVLDIDLLVIVHPPTLSLVRYAVLTQRTLQLRVESCLVGCGSRPVVQGQLSGCCGSLQGVGWEVEGVAFGQRGRGT